MPVINFQDLQYHRERELFQVISPAFEKLKEEREAVKDRVNALERSFYQTLGRGIRLDSHPEVQKLVAEVQNSLCTNFEIEIFLSMSDAPMACVMPRYGNGYHEAFIGSRAVIMVSAHFFNDLNVAERKAILGHEIGHLLFGHVDVPQDLLDTRGAEEDPQLRAFMAQLMKWSICCELSCDAVALVASGGNPKSTSTALLKFSSGLKQAALDQLSGDTLISLLGDQYDEIAESVHSDELSSHPLIPLRLRAQTESADCHLICCYGEQVSAEVLNKFSGSYQQRLDDLVYAIYPGIVGFFERNEYREVGMHLGIAVALADGELIPEELNAVALGLNMTEQELTNMQSNLADKTISHSCVALAADYLERAIKGAKAAGMKRTEAVSLLRSALIVAAIDGHIDALELRIIGAFANTFGIRKQEILYIANQIIGVS